jgi:hypothetical protein
MGGRDRPGLIARLRRRAAAALWAERIAHATLPAGGILLAYLVIALLGFGQPFLWLLTLALAAGALAYGLLRLRPPASAEIDRRIEAASGLPHRPLAAIDDQPAIETPAALALWQEYQARLAGSLATARAGIPGPVAAARDPLALRLFLLLLLLAGIVIAGPAAPTRLAGAFALPAWPFAGPSVTAWVTPPDYAGLPPQPLTPGEPITTLAGSSITVIVNGPARPPAIAFPGAVFAPAELGANSHRADAVVAQSGRLTIGPWWHRLGAWNITVVPPGTPVIILKGLSFDPNGTLKLSWHVQDSYGLASLAINFHVAGHPDALPLTYALPVTTGDGQASLDLSTSPYHGLPVGFTLDAVNLAGKAGSFTFANSLVLPGMALHDPTAIALDQLRQALAVTPSSTGIVAAQVFNVAAAPPSQISAAAALQTAVLAVAMAQGQTGAKGATARLLRLIQEIDAGPDFAPSRALAAADQALLRALQQGLQGKSADSGTLNKLLQAMHDALAQHLSALQPPGNSQPGQPGRTMDPSALDQLAQKIAADEAAGRTEQAAQELQQLQAALNALQSARPMSPAQALRQQQVQQAAQALSQLTNAQAALLDKTNRATATPAEQAALQKQLDGINQQLGKAGIKQLPGMQDAGQAMGDAQGALGQQEPIAASQAETAAIQALQKAAGALAKAGQGGFSIGQGATSGFTPMQAGDGVDGLPDESILPGLGVPAANPAGAIEDQIMKLDSDPALSTPTHQYLRRLLNPGQNY